jgi:hypothetical protein
LTPPSRPHKTRLQLFNQEVSLPPWVPTHLTSQPLTTSLLLKALGVLLGLWTLALLAYRTVKGLFSRPSPR